MMFKTGIIAVTAVAGLAIGAPAAWAACHDDHHHNSGHHRHHGRDDNDWGRGEGRPVGDRDRGNCNGNVNQVNTGRSGGGLINVSDVNLAVPVNVCNDKILSGVLGVLSKNLTNVER